MEKFTFSYPLLGDKLKGKKSVCGVVGSGNLEVIIEENTDNNTLFTIQTSVDHYQAIWKNVVDDFVKERNPIGLSFIIQDSGAIPPVVALRLRQALEMFNGYQREGKNYLELDARERILAIADPDSFSEWLSSNDYGSPYLSILNITPQMDDGIIIGEASFEKNKVLIAAQQKDFMGGSVGEVHGAKLNALFQAAVKLKVKAVVLLIDSGGVRLHEPNAGEIAISEIIRAIFLARDAGILTIGVICGKNGAYGGMGIISGCLDHLIGNEITRIGVSGADVIQAVQGVEAFDAQDRSLVWRVYGGKTRYLQGILNDYVDFSVNDIKKAIKAALIKPVKRDLATLQKNHAILRKRIDATIGFSEQGGYLKKTFPQMKENIFELSCENFMKIADKIKEKQ